MISTIKMQGKRWVTNLLALITSACLLLGGVAAAPAAGLPAGNSTAQSETAPPVVSPDMELPNPETVDYHTIVVKFRDDNPVDYQGGRFAAQDGTDLTTANELLEGLNLSPLFSRPAEELRQERSARQAATGEEFVDLSQYYMARLSEETTFEDASSLLLNLRGLDNVETAYMEPIYYPAAPGDIIPPVTNDFFTLGNQGYLNPAPNGIDAIYAWTITGGRGTNVRVTDVERGWQIGADYDHEDLNISTDSLLGNSQNTSQLDWIAHGTNVVGVIAGYNNTYGITGIASEAEIKLVSNDLMSIPGGGTKNYSTADAIKVAADNSRTGDIIILPIEIQVSTGATNACGSVNEVVPVEYHYANPAVFDAIKAATAAGIIVVEAAGNGSVNLDDVRYHYSFERSQYNSGAIMVGAGDPATHARVCNGTYGSNYGSRVDLQGWGSGIVTTGGRWPDGTEDSAFFASGGDSRQFYTNTFGGTSGAAAMVAGAVASLQGASRDKFGVVLNAKQILNILDETGTPQGAPFSENIGPLPDLMNALDTYLLSSDYSPNLITTDSLRPTLNWPEAVGTSQYCVRVATSTTYIDPAYAEVVSRSDFTPPSNLRADTLYYWKVTPYLNGTCRSAGWTNNFSFTTPNPPTPIPTTTAVKLKNKEVVTTPWPTFTWKDLSNNTYPPDDYQIQVSTTQEFLAADTIEALTFDPYYAFAAPLTANIPYYWRVRSHSGTFYSAWTPWRIFYTTLPAPVLASPADGSHADNFRPELQWNAVSDALGYELQIAKNVNFKGAQKYKLASNVVALDPTRNIPKKATVYWRMRTRGKYGLGAWSAVWSMTTPNPPSIPSKLSPKTKTVTAGPFTPTLTWKVPKGSPVSYEIQFSQVSDFDPADPSTMTDTTPTNSYTVGAALDPDTRYYWHVRAQNAAGDYSNWTKNTILYTGPVLSITSLDSPAPADSLDNRRPVMEWTDATPELSSGYIIQISANPYFTGRKLYNRFVRTTSPFNLTKSLPRNRTLYWRMANRGKYGYSEWTAANDFTTPSSTPHAPILGSPASGTVLTNFSPTLTWSAPKSKPAVSEYTVQVSLENQFAAPIIDDTATTKSYTITPGTFTDSGKYYWRVIAIDIDGNSTASGANVFYTPSAVTGTVDGEGGVPLPGVNVCLRSDKCTPTNVSSVYTFSSLAPGSYTFTLEPIGYMRTSRDLSLPRGTLLEDYDFTLSHVPDGGATYGNLRIQLTWKKEPSDLDAHLWLPATSQAHIWKDNTGGLGASPNAELTLADDDGYGPEVITIDTQHAGIYTYAVKVNDYTNGLLISKARVDVYYYNSTAGTSTRIKSFEAPTSGTGNWWKVFTFNGDPGNTAPPVINAINQIQSTSPAPYVDP